MSSWGDLYESGINTAQNIQSKTLSWLLDVIFAATSFNPPGAIFKQAVINDKKLHDINKDKYQNEIIFYQPVPY